ncbi:hypothetical protein DFH07DRAFT_959816 [Mycena maculata]|uniref:MYND-type domain-containing protein n=1 Tax=Mycena maculata TaxID=230809 RepID=A0AAD7NB53_9AGAR|nr:hypothetical protein DFH07DRAFT_959816 [Mycena maculata]
MNAQHRGELLRKYIETARRQSPPGLAALLDLSMVCADVPRTIELGAVDMFLSHLRAEKAPALTRIPRKWQLDADFAHLSLVALGGTELLLDKPRYQSQARAVVNGWSGIFKWCSYIYDARVASESAQDRRMYLDAIVRVLYVLSRFNNFVVAMIKTAGCLELVTKLWALEDIPSGVESIVLGPAPTATLGILIKCAALLGKEDMYKRVIKASGGDPDFIAQLVLGRIKKATKTITPDLGVLALSWHIDLIAALCQVYPHPLRRAFFDADVIAIITSAFVSLSRIIVQNPTPNAVSMLVSCITFFSQYLEGDDYLSLVHAIKAGFLPAFLDCSPVFPQMPEETVELAVNILSQVLPPYLVYRSFTEAVTSATEKLNTPHYTALVAQPLIQAACRIFLTLLAKRKRHLKYIYELKNEGTPVGCGYVQCGRIDVKNSFKTCANCRAVYYCSPECQRLAWKSSHKAACKGIKTESVGHRDKGRPKTDREALHGLAQWEGDINFAVFHALAERDFPDTPHEDLMPCIDFRRVPEEYSVKVIAPGASGHPDVVFSQPDAALGEERFQTLVAQFRGTGTTIIQTVIASGATIEILTTPMSRKHFWEDKNTYSGSSDEETDDSTDEESGDEDGEHDTGGGSFQARFNTLVLNNLD